VDDDLHGPLTRRDARWTQALAVGSQAFVEKIKDELGGKALHRGLDRLDGTYALREAGEAYRRHIDVKNAAVSPKNTVLWKTCLNCNNLALSDPAPEVNLNGLNTRDAGEVATVRSARFAQHGGLPIG
jgi:hypothetical protein